MNRLDKLITDALAIEAEEARAADALGYMARALTQATMPHRRCNELIFERKNGAFSLALMAHPQAGLPFGSIPRLLIAWLTTEAVRTRERELVLGDSLSDFMRQLDLIPTGGRWGSITRLRDQMTRLFSSSVSCLYSEGLARAMAHVHVVDHAQLWWDPKRPDQAALWRSLVKLGERFFDEVTEHPVPIDMRALRALKRSPMALDLYCWLTYRMSYLRRQTSIPWGALELQFGAEYADTRQGRQGFRRGFERGLRSVLTVYPEANVNVSRKGLMLRPSRPHITSGHLLR